MLLSVDKKLRAKYSQLPYHYDKWVELQNVPTDKDVDALFVCQGFNYIEFKCQIFIVLCYWDLNCQKDYLYRQLDIQ